MEGATLPESLTELRLHSVRVRGRVRARASERSLASYPLCSFARPLRRLLLRFCLLDPTGIPDCTLHHWLAGFVSSPTALLAG